VADHNRFVEKTQITVIHVQEDPAPLKGVKLHFNTVPVTFISARKRRQHVANQAVQAVQLQSIEVARHNVINVYAEPTHQVGSPMSWQ
jgi:hypothetical protein